MPRRDTLASLAVAAASSASLLIAHPAIAAPEATEELPSAVAPTPASEPAPPPPITRPHYERFLVSFEALGLLSNRYGAILEAVPSPRDTVTA